MTEMATCKEHTVIDCLRDYFVAQVIRGNGNGLPVGEEPASVLPGRAGGLPFSRTETYQAPASSRTVYFLPFLSSDAGVPEGGPSF